jgi:hypothetical protein
MASSLQHRSSSGGFIHGRTVGPGRLVIERDRRGRCAGRVRKAADGPLRSGRLPVAFRLTPIVRRRGGNQARMPLPGGTRPSEPIRTARSGRLRDRTGPTRPRCRANTAKAAPPPRWPPSSRLAVDAATLWRDDAGVRSALSRGPQRFVRVALWSLHVTRRPCRTARQRWVGVGYGGPTRRCRGRRPSVPSEVVDAIGGLRDDARRARAG